MPFCLQGDQENCLIRRIDMSSGTVTTLAGNLTIGSTDGVGTAAKFHYPRGVAMDAAGAVALVVSTEG